MNARDLATGAGCLLLAAGYAWLTAQLPTRSLPNTPGPTFFPWVLTAALALLGAVLAVSGARGAAPGRAARAATRFPWTALAAIVAYIALLPWTGFVPASAAFCALLMWIIGERRWWAIAAGAAGMPLVLMLVFRYLFLIPLPRGVFG